MNNATENIISVDQTHKESLWAIYCMIGYIGVLTCLRKMYTIISSKTSHAGDIFIFMLIAGCCSMSFVFATKCLISWINADNICGFDTLLYISFIIVQFMSITAIAVRSNIKMMSKDNRDNISLKKAWIINVIILILSFTGTFSFGIVSDISLMPGKNYCLPMMNSPVIEYWFIPIVLISFFVCGYLYIRIFLKIRKMDIETTRTITSGPKPVHWAVARKATIYMIVYFIDWFPIVIAYFYTLGNRNREMTLTLDNIIGLSSSLNSIWMPIIYDYDKRKMCRCFGKVYSTDGFDNHNTIKVASNNTRKPKNDTSDRRESFRISEKKSDEHKKAILSPTETNGPDIPDTSVEFIIQSANISSHELTVNLDIRSINVPNIIHGPYNPDTPETSAAPTSSIPRVSNFYKN